MEGNMDVDSDSAPCQSHISVPHNGKITLENAFSAADLLAAVRDVVSALKNLYIEHEILHKHIAYNNILIQSAGDGGVQGLVVDLDFPDPSEGSSRDPTGFSVCNSLIFQSAQELKDNGNRTRVHRTQDDLESLFYTLCWACYGFDHTGRPDKFRPAWMAEWEARRTSPNSFGYEKRCFLTEMIPAHVNRYMGCHQDILERVIERLRRWLKSYSLDSVEDYDAILNILEQGIRQIQGESCGCGLECSKGADSLIGAASAKRKLCYLESEDVSKVSKQAKTLSTDTSMDDE
ncbi:hypothetical protein B0H17DRAFT_1183195 [Mycena rosella]|uniref:Fungal-type protein kinase domain-containing protein n=1 Tax=Mycena rosella TaxID=1033263 RepID=A0AAD7GAV2_MYCRO|nr:hypothetical protein B0H17DRAFT_1183195 [Mycena rosella]